MVRNIEDGIKLWLQRRAKRHGWTLEEEVRDILRDAAKEEATPVRGLETGIAALFRKNDLEMDIPELCGHGIKPAPFD